MRVFKATGAVVIALALASFFPQPPEPDLVIVMPERAVLSCECDATWLPLSPPTFFPTACPCQRVSGGCLTCGGGVPLGPNCCKEVEDHCFVTTVSDDFTKEPGICNTIPGCFKHTPEPCCFSMTFTVNASKCCSSLDLNPYCQGNCPTCCSDDVVQVTGGNTNSGSMCGGATANIPQVMSGPGGMVTVTVIQEVICEDGVSDFLRLFVVCGGKTILHQVSRPIRCELCQL